ncbi:hypothetical protein CLI64_27975 [Nostoc sp. CENA543]|nr:hypothetical protein CLI64_27975 [Nostoc sp. CENA543]
MCKYFHGHKRGRGAGGRVQGERKKVWEVWEVWEEIFPPSLPTLPTLPIFPIPNPQSPIPNSPKRGLHYEQVKSRIDNAKHTGKLT